MFVQQILQVLPLDCSFRLAIRFSDAIGVSEWTNTTVDNLMAEVSLPFGITLSDDTASNVIVTDNGVSDQYA